MKSFSPRNQISKLKVRHSPQTRLEQNQRLTVKFLTSTQHIIRAVLLQTRDKGNANHRRCPL